MQTDEDIMQAVAGGELNQLKYLSAAVEVVGFGLPRACQQPHVKRGAKKQKFKTL